MNRLEPLLNDWAPYVLSVLRIVSGFLFLQTRESRQQSCALSFCFWSLPAVDR